ncbi:MAG TPA: DNA polymerase III subunit delta [Verrucomicrobiales bacterium]|nr:DNA polymerase III subunit delta [Verrucomicrobiales bacterium]
MPPARKKAARKTRTSKNPGDGRIYAYTGSEEGRVRDAARAKVKELSGGNIDSFDTETIDGIAENTEGAVQIVGRTIEALLTLPFFGGDKVVWLKNANFFGDTVTGKSQRTLEAGERLLAVLEAGLPPGVSFVLSAGPMDKKRRFYLQLKKLSGLEPFDRADLSKAGWEREVMEHVAAKARQMGLRFTGDSLLQFVMRVGDSSMQIARELEKLDLYLGEERDVRPADVEATASPTRGGVVFEIGNAIGNRDLRKALDRIDHLLQCGETPIGILLAAVVPKVRAMAGARVLMDRFGLRARGGGGGWGVPAEFKAQLASLPLEAVSLAPRKKEGGINEWVLYFACRSAERFTMPELQRALESCLQANLRLVRTTIDPRLVLHEMAIEILAPSSHTVSTAARCAPS